MIKLKDLLEKNLTTEIPKDPFENVDTEIELQRDDDENMDDDEWEDFQYYLNRWLQNIRTQKLTDKIIDVDDLITEFLLMDETTRETIDQMSSKEINQIRKRLQHKRQTGNTCQLYKDVGIKYMGDKGLYNKMLDWEKGYYDKHHRK